MLTELLNVFSPATHAGSKVMPQQKMSGHLPDHLPKNTERHSSKQSEKHPSKQDSEQSSSHQANIDTSALNLLAGEIYQSLGADQADLNSLSTLLTAERAALESRENKVIAECAEEKIVIVKRMEKRNELRTTLLRRNQLSTEADRWKDTIIKLDAMSHIQLLPLWESIEQQLSACQEMLLINERIIGGMQQSVDRFMNILRGETGTGQTYNATGKAENFSNSKPITSA
ncbi:MAG: flagella synthesis protein FlgN [Pseudomonadales bacterium]